MNAPNALDITSEDYSIIDKLQRASLGLLIFYK